MSSQYYKCPYNHWMPCCSYIRSRQSPPLNSLPTTKQLCPSVALNYQKFLELAQLCNGNFIWVCFINKLKFNNGWWRLNGVSNDKNRIILTLERPNNNVENFEYIVDIISIGPCVPYKEKEVQIPGPPIGSPLTKACVYPLFTPGYDSKESKYKAVMSFSGKIVCVAFAPNIKNKDGYWLVAGVSGDKNNFHVTLQRANNYTESFRDEDIFLLYEPYLDVNPK